MYIQLNLPLYNILSPSITVYLFLNVKNFKCGLFQRINREIHHNLSQNRGILNTLVENIARAATKTLSETGRNGDGGGMETAY